MASIWTEGKTQSTLDPFTAPATDAYVFNQRPNKLQLADRRVTHAFFVGLGLKEAALNQIDFSHSTFVRCYFRGTRFRGCDFTGCRFIECEFRNATLVNCTFLYSEWKDTFIDPGQILSNLPEWPNVAHRLLDSLRTNALASGDGPAARRYLFAAMKCSREHYRRIAFSDASYYRDKYRGVRRIGGFLRWSWSLCERWLWGYGESPVLLFTWAAVAVIGFALFYAIAAPGAFGFGSISPLRAFRDLGGHPKPASRGHLKTGQ